MLLPEGLAVGVGVLEAHLLELTAPIQLVVASVRLLSQVLHVHSDQHLPELHEVAVVFILNCKRKAKARWVISVPVPPGTRGLKGMEGALPTPPFRPKEALTGTVGRGC